MEVYSQNAESLLLGSLLGHLEVPSMITVGDGQAEFANAMFDVGLEALWSFESSGQNAASARERFAEDSRVVVHDMNLDPCQALGNALEVGEVPRRVGILKLAVDRQGLDVLRANGAVAADVVCMQHWTDLPGSLGACPWSAEDVIAELLPRGFSAFAFIVHDGEFVTFKWQDAAVERGAIGSLIFLHDAKLQLMLPELLGCAGWIAQRAMRVGRAFELAWKQREQLTDELRRVADERLALIGELTRSCEERLAVIEQLDRTCAERLALIEQLTQRSGPARAPAC